MAHSQNHLFFRHFNPHYEFPMQNPGSMTVSQNYSILLLDNFDFNPECALEIRHEGLNDEKICGFAKKA